MPRSAKQTTASAMETPIAEPKAAIDASAILPAGRGQPIYNYVKISGVPRKNPGTAVL